MKPHALDELRLSLPMLVLSETTTEDEEAESLRILEDFNTCMAGMTRFSGETPWERHAEDELLLVLDGEVDVTILPEAGPAESKRLGKGSLLIVPKALWHRQRAESGVTLLFVTSRDGNDVSRDEDPR